MITSITLYPKTMSMDQIEQHISTRLLPTLRQAPGFVALKVSDGHLMSPAGPPDYSKVVEFSFKTLEDFYAWTKSGGDQDDQKDQLIKAGVVMLFYEEKSP